jgi:hypothetical protein
LHGQYRRLTGVLQSGRKYASGNSNSGHNPIFVCIYISMPDKNA